MSPTDAEELLAGLEIPGWDSTVQADMISPNWQQKADAVTLIGEKIAVSLRVCVCVCCFIYLFLDPLPILLSLFYLYLSFYHSVSLTHILTFPHSLLSSPSLSHYRNWK
jgi:hypothetical protein